MLSDFCTTRNASDLVHRSLSLSLSLFSAVSNFVHAGSTQLLFNHAPELAFKMSSAIPRDDDPWIAPDKLKHVAFCFSLAWAGFLFAPLAVVKKTSCSSSFSTPATAQQRLLTGALLAFLGGALKEMGDFCKWWPGRASLRDAAADAVGAALGLAACALFVAFDCWERGAREWRRRLNKVGNGDADAQHGASAAARSRGEYRGLELSSSSAEGKA